mgnify:CR=1 FL=1
MSELRVELAVGEPGDCPVAEASAAAGRARCIARASAPNPEGRIEEEFVVEGEADLSTDTATEAATYDDRTVYRFSRHPEEPCACDAVEASGHPVSEIRAAEGTLVVTFHAPDFERVRYVVEDLRERFTAVSLRRLTRTAERESEDLVFVDRSRLTERQREVLRTAHRMGYFDYPKGANAGDVAEELDISPSTFAEHLGAAQRKVFEAVLGERLDG